MAEGQSTLDGFVGQIETPPKVSSNQSHVKKLQYFNYFLIFKYSLHKLNFVLLLLNG